MNQIGSATVVTGPNGAGKSTLMAFIAAVLYGFEPGGRSVERNARLRYLPWGEREMGGSLDLRVGGQTYRIERRFGQKKSEDECRIWILESGERYLPQDPHRPGRELLGIGAAVFLNTVFVRTGDIQPTVRGDVGGELQTRLLGDVAVPVVAGRKDLTLKQVLDAVSHKLNEVCSPSGQKGLLPTAEAALSEAEQAWSHALKQKDEIARTAAELSEVQRRSEAAAGFLAVTEDKAEGCMLLTRLQEVGDADADPLSPYLPVEEETDRPFPYLRMIAGWLLLIGGLIGGYKLHSVIYTLAGAGLILLLTVVASYLLRRGGQDEHERIEGAEESRQAASEALRMWVQRTGLDPEAPDVQPDCLTDLQEQVQRQRELVTELTYEIKRLEGRLDVLHAQAPQDPQTAEDRVAELRKQVEELTFRRTCLQETRDRIERAAALYRRETGPSLRPELRYWLPLFTGGTIRDGLINEQLQLRVTTGDPRAPAFVEDGYLSTATRQQVYLALRMSLIEVLGRSAASDPLPLILDGGFADWDDQRFGQAIEALFDFTRQTNRQLMIFTESARLVGWCSGQMSSAEVIIL